jgi:hypothetical protein
MIDIRPVRTATDLKRFIDLPERLYRDDPAWVPALKPELRKHLSKKHNPFFDNGEAELFLALRGGVVVGRISAQVDLAHNARYEEKTGFFGFFETENDRAVSDALLDAAAAWLRNRGMTRIRGPFSFNINHPTGLLVEGFEHPPYLEMTHNLPYYPELVEQWGMVKAKDMFAWRYDCSIDPPEMIQQIADTVAQHPGLVVREVRMDRLEEDLQIIVGLFNEAWSQNWGFVPLTDREIRKMASELKLILDPRMVFIAEVDGEPAAISLTLPNLNQVLRRARGLSTPLMYARVLWDLKVKRNLSQARLVILGIRKKFRGSALGGLSVLLYVKTHWVGKSLGMKEAELSWTLEDNERINMGIQMMGGDPYKRYRVYEKDIV